MKCGTPRLTVPKPIQYNDGRETKSTKQLLGRIKSCVKKVDMEVVQAMFKGVKSKLRKIKDHGPLSLYKIDN